MGVSPIYNVWHQELAGKAELARAESNRKISILEAQAKQESAKMLAQAEIERAKGVAEANKIIGSSLKGNEDYLRYLWIDSLHNKDHSIIYIPTEAGLPILEANRTKKHKVELSEPNDDNIKKKIQK
jgi:regulator of protease activity HflC (stomatin/prohibitin superfamily)